MTGRRATTDVRPGRLALSVGHPGQKASPGWRWVALSDVSTMATGHTPSRKHPEYWGGDVQWMNVGDARPNHGGVIYETSETTNALGIENSAAVILPAGTVCLSRTGSIGYAVILGRPMATSQGFVNWICGPQLLPQFLQQIFLAEQPFLREISEGVAHTTIYFPEAKAFHVCIPSIARQREIVAEIEKQFSRLDEAVTNLKRVKANLKRYKAAVLKGAVEGWLGTKHRSCRPDELPAGWRWTTIGDIASVGTGATPARGNAAFYDAGTIPWVTSSAVNRPFVDSAEQVVTPLALEQTNLTLYPPGTLLVAMYGEGKTRGKCAELQIAATTNQALAALQTTNALRPWLRLFLDYNYENTRKVASGGVQPNLNLSLIRAIRLPLPPLDQQRHIIAEVERHLSIVTDLEKESALNLGRSDAMRQSLLRRTFGVQADPRERILRDVVG